MHVLGYSQPATVRESTRAKRTTTASESELKTWQYAVPYISFHRRKLCEYFVFCFFVMSLPTQALKNLIFMYLHGLKGF